nr:MAG TPA: hypothetical protein [Caudoviricetes sp.]
MLGIIFWYSSHFLLPPFFWFSTAGHNTEPYSGDKQLKTNVRR